MRRTRWGWWWLALGVCACGTPDDRSMSSDGGDAALSSDGGATTGGSAGTASTHTTSVNRDTSRGDTLDVTLDNDDSLDVTVVGRDGGTPSQVNSDAGPVDARDAAVTSTAEPFDAAVDTATSTETSKFDAAVAIVRDAGDASVFDATVDSAALDAETDVDTSTPDAADAAVEANTPFECEPGQSRPCPGAVGNCAQGSQTCDAEGQWSACSILPAGPDSCEAGDDSDCDGEQNEDCECIVGQTATCGVIRDALGECADLELTCSAAGTWQGSCEPTSQELCDRLQRDEDCDGVINEPDACNSAPTVSITTPIRDLLGDNLALQTDTVDEMVGEWYLNAFTLEAEVLDAEDGTLSGTSVVWTTSNDFYDELGVDTVLGTGNPVTVRLYGDCNQPGLHSITVTVTDSFGAVTVSEPRLIQVYSSC